MGRTEKQTVKDKTIIAKIENINHCPNQNTCCIVSPFVHCDYNYKSDACIKAHKNFNHILRDSLMRLEETISIYILHILQHIEIDGNVIAVLSATREEK